MDATTVAILVLMVALAAANGANDVPKGVATLAGAGVARYRTAVAWGTVTTLVGSLLSLGFADRLTKLFSKGIVNESPTPAFTLAVLVGAGAWMAFATVTRLPVSTTQSIVGALVGAGLVLGSGVVNWGALPEKIVLPSLLAIGVAYGISFLLNLVRFRAPECVCARAEWPTPVLAGAEAGAIAVPRLHVETGTVAGCRVHDPPKRVALTVDGLHWLSSGAASLARGLNDTPKIVAVGAFALVPAGMGSRSVLAFVAAGMAVGSLLFGTRVARRLGDDVVRMDHVEGAKANLTTAVLVGLAANRGLPLSTTQVSASAIAGASGVHPSRLHARTVRDFLLAWIVTPATAGLVAAAVFAIAR
ncbi:MAG: inorganic phosphate transporter [Acidimicrobiia bacterium]